VDRPWGSGDTHVYKEILVEPVPWIEMACEEAKASVVDGGGPFGAVLIQVDDETGEVLRYWKDRNHVVEWNDPTAHAEVSVIRSACHELGVFDLGRIPKEGSRMHQEGETSHCEIYSSCEPCPMCYSAISWARILVLVFAATRHEASEPGVDLSDAEMHEEVRLEYGDREVRVYQALCSNARDAFELWKRGGNVRY
jgi:tRNA(Arg) A34 adenosine deaminase TadA